MEFLKKNAVTITGLLICVFFAVHGYQNPSSENAQAMPVYISVAIILLVMLILIYFKHYRKTP